jgi:integrase
MERLRSRCFHHERQQTAFRGKIRPWGKTRKSLGVVHISKKLVVDLKRWRQQCPNPSPEAFIFPNKNGEFMEYRQRSQACFAQARD